MKNRFIVLAVLTTLFFTGCVLARTASALTLIPPTFEYAPKPGETISTKIKLFNETAETTTRYASTGNFTAKDETGVPNWVNESTKTDLASWIAVAPGPYTLKPGERLEIPVEITIPSDAPPGGHYAAIFFSPQVSAVGASQVAISDQIGSLVLLRVAGEIREAGSIAQFTTESGKTKFNRLPVHFAIRFRNDGNVHVRPTGTLTVRNLLGGTSAVVPVNTAQGAVLPASVRKFAATWSKTDAPDTSNFFREFGYEWNNFALGSYTAELTLTYGNESPKTAVSTLRIFIFPWRVLLVSVIVIVFVIWLLIVSIKRYNRMIIARAAAAPDKGQKK